MIKRDKKTTILYLVVAIVLGLILLTLVGANIYFWIKYGNKPVSEIPAWVFWFMWGKR